MKLTEKFLRSKNKDLGGRAHKDFADGNGLLARSYSSGAVTFYYRFRWEGKQGIVKIGSYPAVSLKDARSTHQELRAGVERGVDPRCGGLSRKVMSLKDGYEYWFSKHIKPNRKNPEQLDRSFALHVLDKSAKLVIDEMTIADWEEIVTKADKPVLSGYLLTECKGMISFLMRKQKITNDNIRHIIVTDVGKNANKRDRVYTQRELKCVLDYCTDQTKPIECRLPMLIIMITGCRVSELALAQRSDFDFKDGVWTVPRSNSKNKTKIARPIPEFLRPFFDELYEVQPNTKMLLMNNRGVPMSPQWLSSKLNRLKWEIGVPGMILHSFRHTLTTQYANLNIPPHVAEKQCGHSMAGVMAIYNRADYLKEQLDAMEGYIKWIQS